jgi:serine/threonine protein kinase
VLLPGKDEADQLERIFNVMGQPSEQSMPGCTSYPNWQTAMGGGLAARFPPTSRLRSHCQSRGVADPQALDLLERLLALNPAARIKAQDAVTVRRRARSLRKGHVGPWARLHLFWRLRPLPISPPTHPPPCRAPPPPPPAAPVFLQ